MPKSPVMGVLGPQPHCASGDLACLKHRRSIERQDSRWLSPLLKDNQNNFRHSCNFQSAFLRFWIATEKERRIIISLEVDSILKSPVQTPDNRSRKEYYVEKQWSSLLIKQPWTLEGPPCLYYGQSKLFQQKKRATRTVIYLCFTKLSTILGVIFWFNLTGRWVFNSVKVHAWWNTGNQFSKLLKLDRLHYKDCITKGKWTLCS